MHNDTSPKVPPKIKDDSLGSPQPPKSGEMATEKDGVTMVPPTGEMPAEDVSGLVNNQEKIQDRDWNNGRPEVTKEEVPPLPSHQNPEKQNEASLRENKGNKPGEDPFEASEEVNTGQSGG